MRIDMRAILHDDVIKVEKKSALLAFCAGNSPVTDEFPAQRPVTQFFDLRLNKRLSKQSCGWGFETPLCPLWRHCNALLVNEAPGETNI